MGLIKGGKADICMGESTERLVATLVKKSTGYHIHNEKMRFIKSLERLLYAVVFFTIHKSHKFLKSKLAIGQW